MTGSIYNWSTTAASNANADGDINFAEGQAPSTLNNSSRQVMGRVAEYLADNGGALAAGGTANAITVTANSAFTAYQNGLTLALRITADNTSATTINANGLGAKSVRKMVAAGETALVGAELQQDGVFLFRYSTALNASAGGWLLLNPAIDVPNLVTLTGTQTLTNKTLTSPTINTPTLVNGTSSGMTLTTATLTQPALVLEQSASPTPTAEGRAQWDTDDNVLVVGDGAATQIFAPLPASVAAGDVFYATAPKVLARLAKGTAGQQLRMNAGATAPEWFTPSTAGQAKAWVVFNGTGTVAIIDSFNVSSITDNGTGDYTVNFANAFANTNYAVVCTVEAEPSFPGEIRGVSIRNGGKATGSVRIKTGIPATNFIDEPSISVAVFSN